MNLFPNFVILLNFGGAIVGYSFSSSLLLLLLLLLFFINYHAN